MFNYSQDLPPSYITEQLTMHHERTSLLFSSPLVSINWLLRTSSYKLRGRRHLRLFHGYAWLTNTGLAGSVGISRYVHRTSLRLASQPSLFRTTYLYFYGVQLAAENRWFTDVAYTPIYVMIAFLEIHYVDLCFDWRSKILFQQILLQFRVIDSLKMNEFVSSVLGLI